MVINRKREVLVQGVVRDKCGSIKLKTVYLGEGGGERRDGRWCAAHGGAATHMALYD